MIANAKKRELGYVTEEADKIQPAKVLHQRLGIAKHAMLKAAAWDVSTKRIGAGAWTRYSASYLAMPITARYIVAKIVKITRAILIA